MKRLVFLLWLISACDSTTGVEFTGEPWTPPDVYALQWDWMVGCTNIDADFERVQWYLAPSHSLREGGDEWQGLWVWPHSIYIDERYKDNLTLVRHEIIHDLIQRGDHESGLFDCVSAGRT